ncbi:glycosyltransferase family 2 protein [Acinetobacter ursingii]|uniref:glycosyltransferase family 2 protein n=1 Tax=Acinetobacter ursingii TaxID=108980 RepID=UPI003AF6A1B0
MKNIIALVTVLYKSADVLEAFIQSLVKQTNQDWKLYVVDNNEDVVDKECFYRLVNQYGLTNFEYIFNNKNLGISKGNNQGIQKSLENNFKYTLLLNNDIYFDENCIKDTVEFASINNIDALVPKIYYAGTNKIWMAGGKISKIKGTTVHRGELEEDTNQYNITEFVEYAPTCYMLIDNNIFKNIGIMDERYFVYYDDTDFVYRMNKHGYNITYYPDILVHHMVSFSTGGSESNFSIYQGNKNRLIFIRKHFTLLEKFVFLNYFFISRLIKSLSYTSSQRDQLFKAIKAGLTFRI